MSLTKTGLHGVPKNSVHKSIEAVWKIEAPKLIAALARIVRDIALAEDLAQDALVAALEQWPSEGMPRNPGAWLMAASKRRAIDRLRREKMLHRKHQEIGYAQAALERSMPDFDSGLPGFNYSFKDANLTDDRGDDMLRLIFIACHPILPPDARLALTLRLLGGLTTGEIARAFLVSEPTIAQRIVRAKRTLANKKIRFAIPRGEELKERLASVLSVIYLVFNEGYSASSGEDWLRPALCEDAMRLGRMLAELVPEEPEVHGLVALMELQASRSAARVGKNGEPVLLLDQHRGQWDYLLIHRGLSALGRAENLTSRRGPYALQAAIAACHARAHTAAETDWSRIASLYGELVQVTPSPVIELNRAMAVSMAFGPAAGLAMLDPLRDEPSLARYHRLPSARGDLLFKLGLLAEARAEFEVAASMATNQREIEMLRRRAQECAQ